jgi:hypothetical protein
MQSVVKLVAVMLDVVVPSLHFGLSRMWVRRERERESARKERERERGKGIEENIEHISAVGCEK